MASDELAAYQPTEDDETAEVERPITDPATRHRLRPFEEHLCTVLESAPVILFALDPRGVITLSEGAGLSALGLQPAELVGASVFDLYGHAPELVADFHRALSGMTFVSGRLVGDRIYQTRFSPILDADGHPCGCVGVALDVTAQSSAEAELANAREELNRANWTEAIGSLAGGIVHDLNNLLTVITGASGLAQLQLDDDHRAQAHLASVLDAASRAAELTQRLLTYGRRRVGDDAETVVDEVVRGSESLIRRMLGREIDLDTSYGAPAGRVGVGNSQIEQILLNLVVNARDAMPGGGRFSIHSSTVELPRVVASLRRPTDQLVPHVRLVVVDTGCGMDERTQAQVFEPFFTTKKRDEGSGLGLATVRAIVREADGRIAVSSEPDAGTQFTIDLPLR